MLDYLGGEAAASVSGKRRIGVPWTLGNQPSGIGIFVFNFINIKIYKCMQLYKLYLYIVTIYCSSYAIFILTMLKDTLAFCILFCHVCTSFRQFYCGFFGFSSMSIEHVWLHQ